MGILASAGMAVTLIASRAAASTNRAFFIAFLLVEVGMQRENAAVGGGCAPKSCRRWVSQKRNSEMSVSY